MLVKDVMSQRVVTVAPEESAAVAARLLARYNVGALPVCTSEGRLKGMVTDRDIVLRCVAAEEDPERTRVSEIMTRRVISAGFRSRKRGRSAGWCRWGTLQKRRTSQPRQPTRCAKFRKIRNDCKRRGHCVASTYFVVAYFFLQSLDFF